MMQAGTARLEESEQQAEGDQGECLGTLSIAALTSLSLQELSTYASKARSSQSAPGAYGHELFCRAIENRDEIAWQSIYRTYGSLVHSWVRLKMRGSVLLQREGEEVLVNGTFAKFAQSMTPEKIRFCPSLAACLRYLKRCVMSVAADTIRTRLPHQYEAPLDCIEVEPAMQDLADEVVGTLTEGHLWTLVREELRDDRECLAISLSFWYDMRPREISRCYPGTFPSAKDVYRVKRRVLERLQHNARFKRRLVEELSEGA